MCTGTTFPAWQADAIRQLLARDKISCELIILEDHPAITGKKKWKHLCWHIYKRLSDRRCRSMKDVDLTGDLEAVPSLPSQPFTDQYISQLKEADLDFILCFEPGAIPGELLLEAATYGIWSFHHGDEPLYHCKPSFFWEIYRDHKVTGTGLYKLADKPDKGIVLKTGFVKTRYSYGRNRDQIHKEASRWPALVCRDIQNGHTEKFNAEPVDTASAGYLPARNWQMPLYLIKRVYYKGRESCRSLFFTDYWNIGVAKAPIAAFLDDEKPEVDWYPLRSRNRFLADPFAVVDKDDKNMLHIFYETYPFTDARGKLDYIRYDGSFGPEHTLIKEPFHLSYPYPIRHKGQYYLVPESYEASRVFMYKAMDFPLTWEKSHVLMDGFPGIDSTIIEHEGIFWMFTTDRRDGFRHNLQLFFSEDLFGKWIPHPGNPVKTDIRSARPAGTPFRYMGDWYRPSMDYADKIEGRIYINKVLKLSKTDYNEVTFRIIDPYTDTLFSDKIHTLCEAGEYTIIDGGREAFILSSVYFVLQKIVLVIRKLKTKLF
jgi:hypothetical protein